MNGNRRNDSKFGINPNDFSLRNTKLGKNRSVFGSSKPVQKSNIVEIGLPLIYVESNNNKDKNENEKEKSNLYDDKELYLARFPHFTLIPLAFEGVGLGSYVIDSLKEATNVPHVRLFPKEPPTINYTITNNLDENLFSSILNAFTSVGAIVRTLAPGFDPTRLAEKLFGSIPLLGSGINAFAHAFSGYGIALPKVWSGSEWGISLRIEVEEQLWAWGNDAPDRFEKVMRALKNFTAPRLSKPKADQSSPQQSGQQKTIGNQSDKEVNLNDFFYIHPYFCKILNKNGKVIIPAALVTNASFIIDTKDMIVINGKQYPAVLRVELEFAPLHFSLVSDPENKLGAKANLMSFDKIIEGWL